MDIWNQRNLAKYFRLDGLKEGCLEIFKNCESCKVLQIG